VRWRESAAGTVFAFLALQLTRRGFVWYLSFGTDSYSLIYGSLGAVVAFMLWTYLSSCIVLVGGHVSAAFAMFFRPAPEVFAQVENSAGQRMPERLEIS
jgi:membrane protein